MLDLLILNSFDRTWYLLFFGGTGVSRAVGAADLSTPIIDKLCFIEKAPFLKSTFLNCTLLELVLIPFFLSFPGEGDLKGTGVDEVCLCPLLLPSTPGSLGLTFPTGIFFRGDFEALIIIIWKVANIGNLKRLICFLMKCSKRKR